MKSPSVRDHSTRRDRRARSKRMKHEDRRDAETGSRRLAEIESGAVALVTGAALHRRLEALLE